MSEFLLPSPNGCQVAPIDEVGMNHARALGDLIELLNDVGSVRFPTILQPR